MERADRASSRERSKPNETDRATDSLRTRGLSRRTLLATGVTALVSSAAGCTSVRHAMGMGLPSCSGPQREVPELAVGASREKAPATVTEFTDFECPACASYTIDTLPEIDRRFIRSGRIKYVHHDYPVPVGDWTLPVANAVRSVQAQTEPRTALQFGRRMFANGLRSQGGYSMAGIAQQARQVDADPKQTRRAAEKQPYCGVIRREREQAKERGVEGTPTIFVGEQKFEGPSAEELVTAIEKAIG